MRVPKYRHKDIWWNSDSSNVINNFRFPQYFTSGNLKCYMRFSMMESFGSDLARPLQLFTNKCELTTKINAMKFEKSC